MPRTATNDQAPVFYGFPSTLWSLQGITTNQTLAFNNQQDSIVVVTNIDVVSREAGTSATILIGHNLNNAGLFGAQIGAGLYDSFSWRGYLPLVFGQAVVVLHADAGWDSVGAGFYVPNVLTTV